MIAAKIMGANVMSPQYRCGLFAPQDVERSLGKQRAAMKPHTIALAALLLAAGPVFGQDGWERLLKSESSAPAPAPAKTVLHSERGGLLNEHWERFRVLAAGGGEVEIRGVCPSACTLVMWQV